MKGNHRGESRTPRTIDSAKTVQTTCIYCEEPYYKPKRTQTNVCLQNACQDRLFEARRIQECLKLGAFKRK